MLRLCFFPNSALTLNDVMEYVRTEQSGIALLNAFNAAVAASRQDTTSVPTHAIKTFHVLMTL